MMTPDEVQLPGRRLLLDLIEQHALFESNMMVKRFLDEAQRFFYLDFVAKQARNLSVVRYCFLYELVAGPKNGKNVRLFFPEVLADVVLKKPVGISLDPGRFDTFRKAPAYFPA
jgi:hypothetical protein